ncbi:MAG: DUF3906 family protein [Bacillus sp. (in: firmicutes)]
MYLYRFEVVTADKVFPVIIAASNDQQAFSLVDDEIEKYFLRALRVDEVILYEKKRIGAGSGYVLLEEDVVTAT